MNTPAYAVTRLVAEQDHRALSLLLLDRRNPPGPADWSLFQLRQLLRFAAVRPAATLPDGTVGLGSSCAVWADHLEELLRFTLRLPESVRAGKGELSILTPVGLAVLGHRQGVEVLAPIPGGMGCFRILRVSTSVRQPPERRIRIYPSSPRAHGRRARPSACFA